MLLAEINSPILQNMEAGLIKRLTELSLETGRQRELISQWLYYCSLCKKRLIAPIKLPRLLPYDHFGSTEGGVDIYEVTKAEASAFPAFNTANCLTTSHSWQHDILSGQREWILFIQWCSYIIIQCNNCLLAYGLHHINRATLSIAASRYD